MLHLNKRLTLEQCSSHSDDVDGRIIWVDATKAWKKLFYPSGWSTEFRRALVFFKINVLILVRKKQQLDHRGSSRRELIDIWDEIRCWLSLLLKEASAKPKTFLGRINASFTGLNYCLCTWVESHETRAWDSNRCKKIESASTFQHFGLRLRHCCCSHPLGNLD